MGVNANDVQICLLKLLKLSSEALVKFFVRFPYFSFALLFFFLLYMIFPSVFWFLIYWFPIFVFAAVGLRIFFSHRNAKECKRDEKKTDGKDSGTVVGRNRKTLVHVHSVRRRRAKDIKREDDSQNNVEEKSTICSTSIDSVLVDKRALIEEFPKDIREVEVNSSPNPYLRSYSCVSTRVKPRIYNGTCERSEKFNLGGSETGTSDDSEDEEEAKEAGKKAVEWTADDQKNLMDLGISEIERNQRLESLIARRKARNLFSLQVRRNLMNKGRNDPVGHIAHIAIPKNNHLHPNKIGQFSPGPGSAPSVLIPMRNPFDLPYDPCEEKPDLTGDSFCEEFLPAQNKDLTYCRHESFTLGASFPGDFMQDRAGPSVHRDFELGQKDSGGIELGSQLDKESDKMVVPAPIQEHEPEIKVDGADDQIKEVIQVCEQGHDNHTEEDNDTVQTKSILDDDSTGRPSSSSSSEEDEPNYKIDKDAILKSISSPATRNAAEDRDNNFRTDDHTNSDAPHFVKNISEERLYCANKTLRHRTRPLSIASDLQVELSEISSPRTLDDNLSTQEEEISIYDVDFDKEITSSSEDLWAASSHLSGIDENESRSREVHEVSEKDIIEVGFSRIKKSEEESLSNTLAEKVAQQNSVGAHSFLPPKTDFRNSSQTHTTDFLANSEQESYDPSELLKSELNAIYELNGSKILQDDRGKRIEQSLTLDSQSTEHTGRQLEKQDKCHDMLECRGSESDKPISSGNSEDRLNNMHEHEETVTLSTAFEGHNSHELCQQSEDESHSPEAGISGTAQESDEPGTSASLTNVAFEQIPAASSPCTSPQSVLQQNFSVDNLSEFHQDSQMEVQQFGTTAENNTWDERRTGVSSELFRSSMPLENSTTHLHSADIVQESPKHQEESAGAVDTHIDNHEPTSYEYQVQNLTLFEDMGNGSQSNCPMDNEDCAKPTRSGSSDEADGKLEKFAAEKTPVNISMLVEENNNLGTQMKSKETGDAMHHANLHGSTVNNEIMFESNTSGGEINPDETIQLGISEEKNDSADSITRITTEESSKHQAKSAGAIDKPAQSEDHIQNSALCEDTVHDDLLNDPMDQECMKATTSAHFEGNRGELQQISDESTPATSSVLVEENGISRSQKRSDDDASVTSSVSLEESDGSGNQKKSEQDEKATAHTNSDSSMLNNEVQLKVINKSNGESQEETIIVGVPKDKNVSENLDTPTASEEPANSSSRSVEETTSNPIVNKVQTSHINEHNPEGTSGGGVVEESER